MNNKEPWLAVVLSSFLAGVGQIYSGKVLRGILILILSLILLGAGAFLAFSSTGSVAIAMLMMVAAIALQIWSMFDAYGCAKQGNSQEFEALRKTSKDPWLAVFLSKIFPGLGHFYLRKWVVGIIFIASFLLLKFLNLPLLATILLDIILSFLACYFAYISASVKREKQKNWIVIVCFLILIINFLFAHFALLTKAYLIEIFKVQNNYFQPSIMMGDRIITRRLEKDAIKEGDYIVFRSKEMNNVALLRRVVALGDEIIEIKNAKIFINGKQLPDSSYKNINIEPAVKYGPIVVPAKSVFALGKVTKYSFGEKYFGLVLKEDIVGKVYKIIWPPEHAGPIQ